ncbi:MAG TPA: hypothetical protein VFA24_01420 [Gaiellaceae bacterium]|nr:hypothetical protein [Gaiellaceae bacterium]
MRRTAVPLLLLALLAGCGGSGGGKQPHAEPGTLAAFLDRPGPDVAAVQGTSDYAVGEVRVTFLVVDRQARLISRPRARFLVARSLGAKALVTTTALLEPIGIPGRSEAATGGARSIYVARFRIASPGKYAFVAQPDGAAIQVVGNLQVARHPTAPAVGDRAIPSRTPTLASTHGDLAALTTATPPDRSLLRYSVAGSLAAHVPFVLVFATPKFCTSRTCGPVVDVVRAVQRRFAGRGIRFIHVEIYTDNNPAQGQNRWVREWRLPSEPWVFVVGRDGRIKARFEASVSVSELAAAVRTVAAG